jgi:Cellulase (glycosyl hydrolase family 5)
MMSGRWSTERASSWANEKGWLVGCNYTPAYAVNQIEFWAASTFDIKAIARELAWAADLGFNTVRIYLHDVVWLDDAQGLKARLDQFLEVAAGLGIAPLIVLFDDCWHEPVTGLQPRPRPGIHNSGWARSPGRAALMDQSQWGRLEAYVRDVVGQFAHDSRILAWDVYNEMGNIFMPSMSLPEDQRKAAMAVCMADQPVQTAAALELLHAAFGWIRQIDPIHPLTVGSWYDDHPINQQFYELSDIISFHNYEPAAHLAAAIDKLKPHGRPIWCTEYLNRRKECLFETHLPIFARENIGAWNWGLVDGKTQTKYAWSDLPDRGSPDPWFHDILHVDGAPYDVRETEFIRSIVQDRPIRNRGGNP